jgi:hypothetical protein
MSDRVAISISIIVVIIVVVVVIVGIGVSAVIGVCMAQHCRAYPIASLFFIDSLLGVAPGLGDRGPEFLSHPFPFLVDTGAVHVVHDLFKGWFWKSTDIHSARSSGVMWLRSGGESLIDIAIFSRAMHHDGMIFPECC